MRLNASRQPVKRRLLLLPPKAKAVTSPFSRARRRTQRSTSRNFPTRSTSASSVHCSMATFPNRTKNRVGRPYFRQEAALCSVARPPAAGPFSQKRRSRAAAAAHRLRGRLRPNHSDVAPFRYALPGTSFPARRGKTPSSQVAPQYFSPGAPPKSRRRKARRLRVSGLSNGKRSSSPGRPPVSPLPFHQHSQTRAARKDRTAAFPVILFRPSATPPSEGSSWSPRAARWNGPAPCRRSSRAPPGRCPDG